MSLQSEEPIKQRMQFDQNGADLEPDCDASDGSNSEPVSLKQASHFDGEELVADTQAIPVFEAREIIPTKGLSRLGRSVIVLGVVLVIVQAVQSLLAAWQSGIGMFVLLSAFLSLGSLWIGRLGWKEFYRLKQLKGAGAAQVQGERLRNSVQQGEANRFLDQLCKSLPVHDGVQMFYQTRRCEHTDAEQLKLFDSYVLTPLDQKAKAIVYRYALESTLLLAASPVAVMDVVLILWRNQRMIGELTECYGIELGYWSRIRLLRLVVVNMLYAGVSEAAIDLGNQFLSMEMTGKLSVRVAQGLGGGMLTARLGYQAMAVCRPLAFTEQTRPGLGELYGQLMKEVKRLLFSRKSEG